ncbi:hypothetical protein [Brucella melitensis]|uniref:hypothetical protein n=1 Tax=Brucella melitensis TaxID=29459 RepID=UPI000B43ED1D|nr:hypothetical protein [Brucella melitensis]ARY04720.1 hypothetical protein BK218_00290 [Brucella melitensis]MBN7712444.1 hypothetical protein [Brucella melitensis]
MKLSARQLRTRLAIRILSVLALVFVGFAHKPIDLAAQDSYLIAQYKLPDGSYSALCIGNRSSDATDHGSDQHPNKNGCDACRLSSAFLCPAPANSTGAMPLIAMVDGSIPPQPILRQNVYPPSAPPQAPPFA